MKVLGKNEKLQTILAKEPVVLVKFGAEWCGPCKMIDPILAKMSESTENVSFVSVDVEEHQELATAFNVKSIPALVVCKNGEETSRVVGFHTSQQIKELLTK